MNNYLDESLSQGKMYSQKYSQLKYYVFGLISVAIFSSSGWKGIFVLYAISITADLYLIKKGDSQ